MFSLQMLEEMSDAPAYAGQRIRHLCEFEPRVTHTAQRLTAVTVNPAEL